MSSDAATFTRVVVVAPRTRVDVALPADLALVELMPSLLDMVGERSDDGGASHDGWQLLGVTGDALDRSRGLRALGVLDGASLQLSPTRPTSSAPVYDDVVDAIAAATLARRPETELRETGGALTVAAAFLTCALALLAGGPGIVTAGIAGLFAVLAIAAAGVIRRSGLSTPIAVAAGAGGAVLAGTSGILAVPGGMGAPSAFLGGAGLAVAAILAGMLIGTGATVLTAMATIGGFTALGGLVGLFWSAPASSLAVIAGTVALATLTFAPWLAVRLARLPMPVIPTNPDQLRDEELSPDAALVARRSAVAGEYLDGLVIGAVAVTTVGAALAPIAGGIFGALYAAVVIAVLLLRARTVSGRRQKLAMLIGGSAAAVVSLTASAWGSADLAVPVALAALTLAALAMVVTVTAPRRRPSLTSRRFLDIIENLLLILVLPLALGAIDLYTTVRRL